MTENSENLVATLDKYDDLKTNIKFLALVEKHVCLWKQDSPNYTNTRIKGEAWKEIAKAVNGTEKKCSTRWRYIRQTYAEYVRSSLRHGANVPKYYLVPYVDFVRPYIKFCHHQNVANTMHTPKETTNDDTEKLLEKQFLELIEGNAEKDTKSTVQVQNADAASSSSSYKRKMEINDSEQPKTKYSKTEDVPQRCISKNWMFFESTLTFVDEMSKKQIRRFRPKVMMLLNDILENKSVDNRQLD